MKTDKRVKQTELALREALIQLLKIKSFDTITTMELAQVAGISRTTFYAHYQDKFDMIDQYQDHLFKKVEDIIQKNSANSRTTLFEIFDYLSRDSLFAQLLTEHGTREIHTYLRSKLQLILQNLPRVVARGNLDSAYTTTYYAHAIFGVWQLWVNRKYQETPEQITNFLINLLGI